jgi:DNA-binding CsgD family transcriptional regulator
MSKSACLAEIEPDLRSYPEIYCKIRVQVIIATFGCILFSLYTRERTPHMDETLTQRRLTQREIDILNWVTAGKTDWEIAAIMNLSHKTVNFHIEKAKRKIGFSNRIAAIAVALRDGLIPFPSELASS